MLGGEDDDGDSKSGSENGSDDKGSDADDDASGSDGGFENEDEDIFMDQNEDEPVEDEGDEIDPDKGVDNINKELVLDVPFAEVDAANKVSNLLKGKGAGAAKKSGLKPKMKMGGLAVKSRALKSGIWAKLQQTFTTAADEEQVLEKKIITKKDGTITILKRTDSRDSFESLSDYGPT